MDSYVPINSAFTEESPLFSRAQETLEPALARENAIKIEQVRRTIEASALLFETKTALENNTYAKARKGLQTTTIVSGVAIFLSLVSEVAGRVGRYAVANNHPTLAIVEIAIESLSAIATMAVAGMFYDLSLKHKDRVDLGPAELDRIEAHAAYGAFINAIDIFRRERNGYNAIENIRSCILLYDQLPPIERLNNLPRSYWIGKLIESLPAGNLLKSKLDEVGADMVGILQPNERPVTPLAYSSGHRAQYSDIEDDLGFKFTGILWKEHLLTPEGAVSLAGVTLPDGQRHALNQLEAQIKREAESITGEVIAITHKFTYRHPRTAYSETTDHPAKSCPSLIELDLQRQFDAAQKEYRQLEQAITNLETGWWTLNKRRNAAMLFSTVAIFSWMATVWSGLWQIGMGEPASLAGRLTTDFRYLAVITTLFSSLFWGWNNKGEERRRTAQQVFLDQFESGLRIQAFAARLLEFPDEEIVV